MSTKEITQMLTTLAEMGNDLLGFIISDPWDQYHPMASAVKECLTKAVSEIDTAIELIELKKEA